MKTALTFDDGPNGEYTLEVLKILQEHKIKACFFLLGKNVERQPEIALKIKREGHLIGNHTYGHQHLADLTPEQLLRQIEKAEAVFKSVLGITPKFIRMPYGESDERVEKIVKEKGYTLISWDPRIEDYNKNSPEEIADEVMDKVEIAMRNVCHCERAQRAKQSQKERLLRRQKRYDGLLAMTNGKAPRNESGDGTIITLHDGANIRLGESRKNTVRALPGIIRMLKDKGFEFVRLDVLMTGLGLFRPPSAG